MCLRVGCIGIGGAGADACTPVTLGLVLWRQTLLAAAAKSWIGLRMRGDLPRTGHVGRLEPRGS